MRESIWQINCLSIGCSFFITHLKDLEACYKFQGVIVDHLIHLDANFGAEQIYAHHVYLKHTNACTHVFVYIYAIV